MSLAEWEFLEGRRLPWPTPWHDLFARTAPLMVEIGFGGGQFLLHLAARHPEANLVGLEISQPSLRKAQRKIAARSLQNVRLVHAAAEQALWTLFAPRSLSAAHINFPDPWPKAEHQSRRLIDPSFLDLLASRTHEGAALDIATDVAAYAAETAEHLRASPYFESRLPEPFTYEDPARIRTKYETIARAEGRQCHYFHWRRNARAVQNAYPVPPEFDMPHVIFHRAPPLAAIAAAFAPGTHAGDWGTVRFIDIYQARDHRSLLVDAYLDEPALSQRLALHIRARQDGSVVVSLHELGFPRPTAGAHHAIRHLADTLRQQHPQLEIVSSNLIA